MTSTSRLNHSFAGRCLAPFFSSRHRSLTEQGSRLLVNLSSHHEIIGYRSLGPICRLCPKFTTKNYKRSYASSSHSTNRCESTLCILFHEIESRLESKSKIHRSAVSDDCEGERSAAIIRNSSNFREMSIATLTSTFCRDYLSLSEKPTSSRYIVDDQIDKNCSDPDEKSLFLELLLGDEFGINQNHVILGINNIHSHLLEAQPTHKQPTIINKAIRRMREICTPKYERIFHFVLRSAEKDLGVSFLVQLRHDLREVIYFLKFAESNINENGHEKKQQKYSKLQAIDYDIQSILTSLFRPGVLNLQRISYDKTPASIIEQIAFKEAVHPLRNLKDLRTRLGPGRRCYAFFHPALPDKPLVFVHVALLQKIPESMDELHCGTHRIIDGVDLEAHATCATFYSITNTEKGLSGVDLGNHLIKSVVQTLKDEFPNLATFCTLSPIPNFSKWLEEKITRYHMGIAVKDSMISSATENVESHISMKFLNDYGLTQQDLRNLNDLFPSADTPPLQALLEALKSPQWQHVPDLSNKLKAVILKLAAYYLTIETHHGRTLCPVANFHLRNGAEMYRLNYLGDKTSKGMRNSFGVMVNYQYLLENLEQNQTNYDTEGKIVISSSIKQWLDDHHSFK